MRYKSHDDSYTHGGTAGGGGEPDEVVLWLSIVGPWVPLQTGRATSVGIQIHDEVKYDHKTYTHGGTAGGGDEPDLWRPLAWPSPDGPLQAGRATSVWDTNP